MIRFWTIIHVILHLSLFAKVLPSEASVCNLKDASFAVKKTGRLNGHLLETQVATRSAVDCVALCSRNNKCASVNYFLDNQNCELNDQSESSKTAPDQFVVDKSALHFEIQATWLQWGAWSKCSSACGNGTQTRIRTCCGRVAKPSCDGIGNETKHCSLQECDVKNCGEISKDILGDGSKLHEIDPDGTGGLEPFLVTCSENGDTIIPHDLEVDHHVSGSGNAEGSYIKNVAYSPSLQHIIALIDVSSTCSQYIQLRCIGSTFYQSSVRYKWWQDRHGDIMINWGTPKGTIGCDCGVKGECTICNCNKNDGVWREDDGYLRDKDDLPVTAVSISDTDGGGEAAYVTVGPLICSSN